VNTLYIAVNFAGSHSNLSLSLVQIQMLTCVIVHTPSTLLETKMSVLNAAPFVCGRAVVPEVSSRVLSTEE